MARSIVIAGALARRPDRGGHAWVLLQYLLGFQRLGFEVTFLDRIESSACIDRSGHRCDFERSWNRAYFWEVVDRHGLLPASCLIHDRTGFDGLRRSEVLRRLEQCQFLLNVMGYLDEPELLSAATRRVFLDIDPGFGQMWRQLGWADVLGSHETFVTVGSNVGEKDCGVPTCGLSWIRTVPPVVLDHWPADCRSHGGAFTSVATWRGPFEPIEFAGQKYGVRAHEFRKFLSLPARCRGRFRIALDIDPVDAADIAALNENRWTLDDPRVAATPHSYRNYVQQSLGELSIAKGLYVQTRSGWFSDRSACYLASGKPVVAQDTGWSKHYPCGRGLIGFTTIDEAARAIEQVLANYDLHAAAARRLAQTCFESDTVLSRLLEALA
jgi:hypothetical protein